MALQRIPANQQDALPLVTLDATINGGSVSIVNGVLIRQFGPADTGLSAVGISADPDTAGSNVTIGTQMDVTGCRFFNCILTRNADTLAHDAALGTLGINVYVSMDDMASNRPRTGANIGVFWNIIGNPTTVASGSINAGLSYPVSIVYPKLGFGGYLNGQQNTIAPIGNKLRIAITAASAVNPANGVTFSVSMWASS